MATLVEKGSDSGVNLSELTSGERALIGMLGQVVKYDGAQSTSGGNNYGFSFGGVDTSKISSINVTISKNGGDNGAYVYIFGASFLNKEVGTYQRNISNNDNIGYVSAYPKDSYGCHVEFTINSFTTKDGKVHTADNLNY